MRLTAFSLITLLAASTAAHAHFDFNPAISPTGKIYTAGFDDENSVSVPTLTVAGYDFGEEPSDPYNISDPGFNTLGPSAYTGGSQLRLAGRAAIGTAFLSYWDGTGEPTFTPAPTGISLLLIASPSRFATFTANSLTYTPASDASLLVGTFAANGSMHQHLGSSIFFNGDQAEGSVPEGAYLLSFTLTNPGTGLTASDPLYIIYNNGLSEDLHDAAIDYVATNVVPEPTFAISMLPALALLKRRR